jgi:hypothetical protein
MSPSIEAICEKIKQDRFELSKHANELNQEYNETLIETKVTYSLEMNGQFFLIENVPARVNVETGEQFFSPATLERIKQIISEQTKPSHFIETPVYDFAA